MKDVLSKAEYNGIYDIQVALVCLEFFRSVFAENISKTNAGYGYIVEAWSKASMAATNVEQLISDVNIVSASAKTDGPKDHPLDGLLPKLVSTIATATSAISELLKDKTSKSLTKAIKKNKIIRSEHGQIEQWIVANEKVIEGLLGSLPAGHKVVTATKLMNLVISAMEEQLLLQAHKAPAFHLPTEPVLAFSESGTSLLQRVNRNGLSNYLPCRDRSNVLTSVTIESDTVTSPPKGTFDLPTSLSDNEALVDLLKEGYLLAPKNNHQTADIKKFLAAYEKVQEHQNTPPIWKDKEDANDRVSFKGTLPYYIGLNVAPAENRFLPLFLSWTVAFHPMQMNNAVDKSQPVLKYQSDIIYSKDGQSNFKFHGSDLEPAQEIRKRSPTISFSSQMLLSDGGNISLNNQISLYFKHKWKMDLATITAEQIAKFTALQSELYQTYQYFKKDHIFAQGLSGFNAALLERIQAYPFSFNYLGDVTTNFAHATKLFASYTEIWNQDGPSWKSFNPITKDAKIIGNSNFSPLRAGYLTIDTIEIVDVFGRFIEVDHSAVNIAQSMQLPKSDFLGDDKKNTAYLAPRFVQPTRLRFLWTSAKALGKTLFSEYNANPAYSPICGWLMPNHLDNSMYLYDIAGDTLGYFETPDSVEDTLKWRSKPQSGGGGEDSLSDDIADANAIFKRFINEFLFKLTGSTDGTAAMFYEAILNSNQYLMAAGLREKLSMAIIKGRGLVLAQAKLKLERYGEAAVAINHDTLSNYNHNYKDKGTAPHDDLTSDTQRFMAIDITENPTAVPSDYPVYKTSQRNTAGIEEVDMPVVIGNDAYLNDGLVGYFIDGDFRVFYAVTDITERTAKGISIQKASPILLNLKDKTSVALTLVMDPRVAVHATSGMLPEVALKIPADEYQRSLDQLNVYLNVTPILLGRQQQAADKTAVNYEFPLPKELGYEWSWVQPSLDADEALTPNTLNDKAKWNIYPLELQDGWLKLKK